MTLREIFRSGRIIPVITIPEVEAGVALSRALVAGGLNVLEITLRTPVALDALRAVKAALPDAIVGVGTVMTPAQLAEAKAQGAAFAVSPGLTPALMDAAAEIGLPLLPGAQTVSEVMRAREAGFTFLKFFPAESTGGIATLKDFAPVFPDVGFCPTGGISLANTPDYLAQPNVMCVGGTFMIPKQSQAAGDWAAVEAAARSARALG
ncbi:MAG: bifunctional 4-hydroxy-2-oxoglutarate aldolase/2-dehydro-3-deoxy-phosphogluconate aldolase [Alphaproteobacteria bacterium]